MKLLVFGSGLAAAAILLVPQQAQALQVTTAYVPFQYRIGSANVPLQLSFPNFSSFNIPGTVKNVLYSLAANSQGTGDAAASGSIRVNNTDSADPATVTGITYTMDLNFNNPVTLAKMVQTDTSLTCVTASANCVNNGNGSVTVADGVSQNINLSNPFSGVSNSWGLQDAAQTAYFTSGNVQTTSYTGTFNGITTNPDTAFNFTANSITNTATLSGFIALIYDYDPPAASNVPGPLSILGATAAFGWSRKLRQRISSQA